MVSAEGENLGTGGDPEEIMKAEASAKPYLISGCPRAAYIGAKEIPNGMLLYWKDADGIYYVDAVGVMETERWFQEIKKRQKKKSIRRHPDADA